MWCYSAFERYYKILGFNHYQKYDKTPSIHYADPKSLIKRIDEHKNDYKKSYTTKVGEHIPCGYLMSTIWTSGGMKNKHDACRGEEYRKKFSKSLRVYTMKIIFEKKKMIPLTKDQQESYYKTKICYI